MNDSASLLGPVAHLRGRRPFTSERSRRGYRLNRFFSSMCEPAHRASFKADPESYMADYELSERERDMVRRRDFEALLDHGACLLTLGNALHTMGLSLVDFGAIGRSQSAAEFIEHKRAESKGQPWQF